jgi:hypothetical protein
LKGISRNKWWYDRCENKRGRPNRAAFYDSRGRLFMVADFLSIDWIDLTSLFKIMEIGLDDYLVALKYLPTSIKKIADV